MTQTDLLSWRPSPPAEPTPTPERYTAKANPKPRDYTAAWCAFVKAHHDVAAWMLATAQAATGRVSVDALFVDGRVRFGVQMNNSHRAAAADWLTTMDARLGEKIERRKRKVTK